MAENIGAISGEIRLDSSGFKAGLSGAGGGLSSFGKQAAATALGLVGAGSIYAALNTVKQAVTDSIKDFMAFESAMAEVSTLVDTSTVDMGRLEKGVVDLSKKYGEDAGGLANALYQTISAGIDTGDALMFLEVGVKAAIGGVTDAKTAIDALTSIVNAYGMSASEVNIVSDSLFTTIKLGKTTMAELAGVIGRVAPIAAVAGISLDELNNGIATLTLTGLSTDEAGTAIRAMMMGIIKPAEQAKDAAEILNIELSVGGMKAAGGFSKFMEIIQEKTGGSSEVMAKLFPNIRAINAALILTSDQGLKKFNENITIYTEKLGAADEATKKMMETSQVRWGQIFKTVASGTKKVGGFISNVALKTIGLYRDIYKEIKTETEKQEGLEIRIDEEKEARIQRERKRAKILAEEKKLLAEKNFKLAEERAIREKEREDEILQKKEDLKKWLETNLIPAEEAIHNTRIRQFTERIQQLENEKNKKETVETRKWEIEVEQSNLRQLQATTEYNHASKMLDMIEKQKILDAGKDKELLNEIETWYSQASQNIIDDWQGRVSKELIIKAEAQFKIDQTVWDRLGNNIHNNFAKWANDLQSGSTSAWSNLISSTNGAINEIGDMFGGLPKDVKLVTDSLQGLIVSALSGDPIQMGVGILKTGFAIISQALGDTGEASKEAAKQEKRAAEEALRAAKAFLKSQGKIDLSLQTFQELEEMRLKIEEEKATFKSKIVNITKEDIDQLGKFDLAVMRITTTIGKMEIGKIPTPAEATTFAGARTALEMQKKAGAISEEEFKKQLKERAEFFWETLTPQEFQNVMLETIPTVVKEPDIDLGALIKASTIAMAKKVEAEAVAAELAEKIAIAKSTELEALKLASEATAIATVAAREAAKAADEAREAAELEATAIRRKASIANRAAEAAEIEMNKAIAAAEAEAKTKEEAEAIAAAIAASIEERRQDIKDWLIKQEDDYEYDRENLYQRSTLLYKYLAETEAARVEAVKAAEKETELQDLTNWLMRVTGDFPSLQKGGIVTQPILASLGEAGAEAVIPLEDTNILENLSGLTQPSELNINVDISPDVLDRLNEETAIALSDNLGESIATKMRAGGI